MVEIEKNLKEIENIPVNENRNFNIAENNELGKDGEEDEEKVIKLSYLNNKF